MKYILVAAALFAGATAVSQAQAATVLVTGSNKGIGLEFVKEYAKKEWTVSPPRRMR